jgi:TolB-like protein
MSGKRKTQNCTKIYIVVTVLLWLVFSISASAQQRPAAEPAKEGRSQTVITLAFFDFFQDGPRASPNQADFSEMISLLLLDHFHKQGSFKIVERKKLAELMAELNLGSSMIADLDTRLRLGRLLGADYFVFGSYLLIGDQLLVSAHIVSVESGLIVKAVDVDGDKVKLETVVNRLAVKLLDGFRMKSEGGGS